MKASEIKSVSPITPTMTNYREGQRFVTPPNGSDYLAMLGVFSRQNGGFETFNADVSTAIGGYPAGAVLTYLDTNKSSATFGQYTKVISCIDDNTDNFVEHPDHIDAWFESATSMTIVPTGTQGAVQHWKRVTPMIPTADGNAYLAAANVEYVNSKKSTALVGSIVPYMGTDLPEGYLMCDGSEVSKETYADLYAVIGTRFGESSNPSKFKLPKINDGRYLQGSNTPGTVVDAGLPNISATAALSNLTTSESGEHYHGIIIADNTGYTYCVERESRSGGARINTDAAGRHSHTINGTGTITIENQGVYGKSNTVTPLSITVRYLICYK